MVENFEGERVAGIPAPEAQVPSPVSRTILGPTNPGTGMQMRRADLFLGVLTMAGVCSCVANTRQEDFRPM